MKRLNNKHCPQRHVPKVRKFPQLKVFFSEYDDNKVIKAIKHKEGYKPVVNIRFKTLEPLIPEYGAELNRKYVTYELLWNEYRQDQPDGYGYTRFKALIQAYEKAHTYSYHNVSAPGVEMQVDFAGDKLAITDRKTGLLTPVVVLCCSLTYSSLAFVMALLKATQEHFYYGLATCLDYFGGVPQSVKSDNMRQWVSRSDRYEPSFNEATMQWGLHYNQTVFCQPILLCTTLGADESIWPPNIK